MRARRPYKPTDFFQILVVFVVVHHGFLDYTTSSWVSCEAFLFVPQEGGLSLAPSNTRIPRVFHATPTETSTTEQVVDVAIVGAGLGGLCAGAILNTLYNRTVGIYESHYLAGGCAHAFTRRARDGTEFTFDSGPTILLGCSSPPFNALQQVLEAVGQPVDWIPYDGWGVIENPMKEQEARWRLSLGPDKFEDGPLKKYGGEEAVQEFKALKEATKGLIVGAEIPAIAMRSGPTSLVPLLKFFPTLVKLISQGETLTGTFAPFMDGPLFTVKNPWLRNWLDALAFSLSGLPASRTGAAAMAFVLYDMHREGAALDYPRGGMGTIVDALVRGVEKGSNGSKLHLRRKVTQILGDASRATGIQLEDGTIVHAKHGVICNAPVWSIHKLLPEDMKAKYNEGSSLPRIAEIPPSSWNLSEEGATLKTTRDSFPKMSALERVSLPEMTGSFLHLHLALNATGLDLDALEAHYTVMDRSLGGDKALFVNNAPDGPCGELNMIAVSNPCVIDRSLAPDGYIVVHAYAAGNEPFEYWESLSRNSEEYRKLKETRAGVLWRAVESIIPDVQDRAVVAEIGSPLTHERFLRRPRGTYGSATEDYLPDGRTPIPSLVLAGDSIFPGIGVPSVAISGTSAANSLVSLVEQWKCMNVIDRKKQL